MPNLKCISEISISKHGCFRVCRPILLEFFAFSSKSKEKKYLEGKVLLPSLTSERGMVYSCGGTFRPTHGSMICIYLSNLIRKKEGKDQNSRNRTPCLLLIMLDNDNEWDSLVPLWCRRRPRVYCQNYERIHYIFFLILGLSILFYSVTKEEDFKTWSDTCLYQLPQKHQRDMHVFHCFRTVECNGGWGFMP